MTSSNHISKLSTYTLYFQLILFTAYKKNLKRLKRLGAMSKGGYLKNDTNQKEIGTKLRREFMFRPLSGMSKFWNKINPILELYRVNCA